MKSEVMFKGSDGKYHFLYKTTNTVNGKMYLGKHSTPNLSDGYRGSGLLLKLAISKYGEEKFNTEILSFHSSKKEVALAESELISDNIVESEQYYNLVRGGQGGDSKNFYRNNTPKEIAGKAALTLKSRKDVHLGRNSKIQSKIQERVKNNPGEFLALAKRMNDLTKGANKENSEFIRRQISNRKANHAAKMEKLKNQFFIELEKTGDVQVASVNSGVSSSTGYRFVKSSVTNNTNLINTESNLEESPL